METCLLWTSFSVEYMMSDTTGALILVGDMGDAWALLIQTFVYLGVFQKGQD